MFGLRGRGARRHSSRQSIRRFEALEQRIALSGTPPTVTNVTVSSTQWSSEYVSYLNDNSLGTDGFSIPVGSTSQTTALPWNNIDQIRITFNEDVHVQAADMALTGVNATSYTFSNFFYDPDSKAATWTLAAPLPKDRLLIDLDGDGINPVIDLDNNALDGEWVNNSDTFQSIGDSTADGDFEFLLNVLPGEVNATTQVTTIDYLTVNLQNGKSTTSTGYNFKCDVDGSGLIDSADSQFVSSKLSSSLPTGSPAGVSNDAPSATPISPVNITNVAVDHVISLWDNFDDNESGATGLTYSIAGNTAASLFDDVTINSSTGELTLNAKSSVSGVATVTVSATDSSGISTRSSLSIDVGGYNQPPTISVVTPEDLGNDLWRISGTVSDDQDPTGLIIQLYGLVDSRAVVYPDGTFSVVIDFQEDPEGNESMRVADALGGWSNIPWVYIGV
jgi:hypothetical protein